MRKKKDPRAVGLGSVGGRANFNKIGREGMKELSKKGHAAKKAKKQGGK